MILLLYTLLMSVVLVLIYPAAWILSCFGRIKAWERFHVTLKIHQAYSERVWIHAASVGEAGIAFSMAGEIKRKHPKAVIYISTITSTGLDRVRALNETQGECTVEGTFFAPFDHPVITSKFVRTIKPSAFILVETELWPWLIRSLHRKNIPISIINGKLSRRSFRRYMLISGTIKNIAGKVSLYCVQSRTFAKRYRLLGVPQERIEIIGNVKFDGLPEKSEFNVREQRRYFRIPDGVKVFTAGSTRPGEEEIIARSFDQVLGEYPDAFMVIAPRHLNRITEVEKIIADAGFLYAKRTDEEGISGTEEKVLILDTLGELIRAFACADAAFVGGSLSDFSGHNPLEPAALGVPVIFGPYMEQTGSKELLSEGAAVLVHDEFELAEMILRIFEGGEKSRIMSQAGPTVVRRFKGTLARTLQCMENRKLI